jgi:hypothetical protein
MPTAPLSTLLLAFHQGGGGGGTGSPLILVGFLGIIATAVWVLFSELRWRNTMLVTAAGWTAVVAVAFVL